MVWRQSVGNSRFNTQPPEGGWRPPASCERVDARFNTQPPEGGWGDSSRLPHGLLCFNTQPPEGGWVAAAVRICLPLRFQHAAARRRLAKPL